MCQVFVCYAVSTDMALTSDMARTSSLLTGKALEWALAV